MRHVLVVLSLLVGSITSAQAQVNVGIGIGLPGVSIGIDLPIYPTLVVVPGYPVYYAPQADSNYFFYDGVYWVYRRDNWYASSWYNGPWSLINVDEVPLFVLRVPVRYYREPPTYFRGWRPDAPPRWGEHWGHGWDQRHRGWDHWERSAVPRPAPLPVYQKQYSGTRYPRAEQQTELQSQNYRYQPREAVVQQRFHAPPNAPGAPGPAVAGRRTEPQGGFSAAPDQRGSRRPPPQMSQEAPAIPRGEQSAREQTREQSAREVGAVQQPSAAQHPAQRERPASPHQSQPPPHSARPSEQPDRQPPPAAAPREQDSRKPQQSAAPREPQARQPHERDRGKGEQRDGGHDK